MENAAVHNGLRALELLFARPGRDGVMALPEDPLLERLRGAFLAASEKPVSGRAAVADYLNAIQREAGDAPVDAQLAGRLFDLLIDHKVLPADLEREEWSENTAFLLRLGLELLAGIAALTEQLPEAERRRVFPAALELFRGVRSDLPEREFAAQLLACDRFRRCRTFRYLGGKFIQSEVTSAKPVERFFGYLGMRTAFQDHFRKFAAGKTNLPLLVNSLPGYGKTSLTVSFALAEPELVLILPDPEAVEKGGLELGTPLAARPDHKFVLFFDDIDPRHTDWYSFRTYVGGAFTLPPNVMPVLAANYEFPANILSRGRKVTFPVFDEVRCTEMIEEFLQGTFGLKQPRANLVSVIAADYTEDFGQKKFTELSPRSLIRYLSMYEQDRIKRKTIMELSFGELITRPDAELFYEFNIELMRALYGEEYIKRLLKERLRALE